MLDEKQALTRFKLYRHSWNPFPNIFVKGNTGRMEKYTEENMVYGMRMEGTYAANYCHWWTHVGCLRGECTPNFFSFLLIKTYILGQMLGKWKSHVKLKHVDTLPRSFKKQNKNNGIQIIHSPFNIICLLYNFVIKYLNFDH